MDTMQINKQNNDYNKIKINDNIVVSMFTMHTIQYAMVKKPFYFKKCYTIYLTFQTIGVSGSRDVSGLCLAFGRHVPPNVSTLSFKLKAET